MLEQVKGIQKLDKEFMQDCNEIRLLEEKRKAEQREREINATFKKEKDSFIYWPTLKLTIIAVGISSVCKWRSFKDCYLGIGLFPIVFRTMILNNTFILRCGWRLRRGFVKFQVSFRIQF